MKKVQNLVEMEDFARQLAQQLEAGDVLLLDGDLGAGKTTFSQFLGRALGVTRTINSPTFNIIKSYKGSELKFHHMDCYRLEDSEEDLGFDEYFNDEAVTVIEWSQFIEEYLPDTFLKITITVDSETERTLYLEAVGAHYETVKEAVEHV
ncbi:MULTISPECIES: tRNA (adenosine(37)-N6)-threonylcarbamoyltransferase complex ATPase subunit type 1 TsaE [unclassified Staphylococcus]|uniref:tRNA (adenosine(37)-N6)-threonylcarbamoyltransferase complex ATPase subunit type 1 TsaE n=1 Tax=unclassified Staphylococcus TaxID=91994 RepID=UPI0021CF42DE|nr:MULTISPECIES: tRNA (adenosine(37)-N6)-threonylcarbamoyltransferase complex ATPase subunit type 1 TsaE [unclassified Staphylococcus]UXR77825.1 tRNA (adenosine(37)-N6)-threonylcarbamoyltransferase complex ATPase subunit type 1 TsaE [Staphylococcus sp. IVB6227]UXR81984.1 tRNA (adenosine(37)-N6)-threonylcarbamoyltransferase complex ATPase subunit type 1 TsaE [Staphylococcus sp. IVB6214]